MAFSESLTVRILGDSSGLRRELQDAVQELGKLQERLGSLGSSGEQLNSAFASAGQSVRPLQQVSQWLTRIAQQVQSLSRTPVSLNVQPAIQALQQLFTAAQATAAMLRSLSVGPVSPGKLSQGPGAIMPRNPAIPEFGGRLPRFSSGGIVTGPPGLDRVHARLSVGEYVLNQSAVERWGLALLDAMNSTSSRIAPGITPASVMTGSRIEPLPPRNEAPLEAPRTSLLSALPETSSQRESRLGSSPANSASAFSLPESPTTHNHFGGITIQVRETADVDRLIRDLRQQGIQLRNRRG